MLTLAEELFLLALNDEKGFIIPDARLPLRFGLTGAILFELVLLGKLEVKKKKIVVLDSSSTTDEIFDAVLQKISSSKNNRSVSSWLLRFNTSKLTNNIINRLITKRILRKVDRKILKFIPSTRYPIYDGKEKKVVREQLRSVFLRNKVPDQHLTLLINLIYACDLTWELFSREEKKLVKKRVKEMVKKADANLSIEQIKNYMIETINSYAMPGS